MLGRHDLRVAGREAAALYLLDAVDHQVLAREIIAGLHRVNAPDIESLGAGLAASRSTIEGDPNRGLEHLLQGDTLILLAGDRRFLAAASRGTPHRQVERPVTERVIKGPQEGMVEDLDVSLALVRKHLRTPRLRVQETEVGTLSRKRCAVLHIDGITNPPWSRRYCAGSTGSKPLSSWTAGN